MLFVTKFCVLLLALASPLTLSNDINSIIISSDLPSKALGEEKFTQFCASCHNFKEDSIGPNLGAVTTTQHIDWLVAFIKNPSLMIKEGDAHAVNLLNTFKLKMPPFDFFSNKEMTGVLSYIHAQSSSSTVRPLLSPHALQNPIVEKSIDSGITVNIEEWLTIPASSNQPPLAKLSKLTYAPKTNWLFVQDLRGKLYKINHGTAEEYFDLSAAMPNFIHAPGLASGFGSFTFHPDFLNNGLFYTSHSERVDAKKSDFNYDPSINIAMQWVITEWKTHSPREKKFSGISRELFRIDMVNNVHGIQELAFNPFAITTDSDYGLLYIALGDGGAAQKGYPFLCNNLQHPWGKILRINPQGNDSSNNRYGIPPTNPFYKSTNPSILKEIFASGFRNPHRMSWDHNQRLFVTNIGQHNIESIYLVNPGSNSGWPLREGTFRINTELSMYELFPLSYEKDDESFNYPIAQYDHDDGNAIANGFEYRGTRIPALQGKFIFGDIVNGRLFFIAMKDVILNKQAPIYEFHLQQNGVPTSLLELCHCEKIDQRLALDSEGEIYITTKHNGIIYRLK